VATLNISARSEDERARALSNFSPFYFYLRGHRFASREGFIVGIMLDPESLVHERYKAFESVGFEAKKLASLADRQFIYWLGERFTFRGPEHISLIESGIRACFLQNPQLMEFLHNTKGMTLIHDTGRPENPKTSLPASEFCAILTSIRDWKPFFFDGNLAFGHINSLSEWVRIVKVYDSDIERLREARSCNHPTLDVPSFGFRREFTDLPTLGEWADTNCIDLTKLKVTD
jgi:hypothetical protein